MDGFCIPGPTMVNCRGSCSSKVLPIEEQPQCGGNGQWGSRFGAEVLADGEADPVRMRGLIQGAIDIVCGGRLSQIPLRDGVAVCLLVEVLTQKSTHWNLKAPFAKLRK